MKNNMQITANWSISIPEVEFQYDGRLYFEIGCSYISAAVVKKVTVLEHFYDFLNSRSFPELTRSRQFISL